MTQTRTRQHPLWSIVRSRYEFLRDFAHDLQYSQEYVSRVKNDVYPLTAEFRRRCSAVLGRPESELFLPQATAPEATANADGTDSHGTLTRAAKR